MRKGQYVRTEERNAAAMDGWRDAGAKGMEKGGWTQEEQKMDAAPGLPGRSPIPVLFRPKGA